MEKFGPVKYAVLCKVRELQVQKGGGLDEGGVTHKGTGFVQFKDP
jgi:hypothetical protein